MLVHYAIKRSVTKLTRHNRTHTEKKPFVCQVYNERFTVASSLKINGRMLEKDFMYVIFVVKNGNHDTHKRTR